MFNAFIERLKQGFKTGAFPIGGEPSLPPDFRGRPEIDDDTSGEEVERMQAVCPSRAR